MRNRKSKRISLSSSPTFFFPFHVHLQSVIIIHCRCAVKHQALVPYGLQNKHIIKSLTLLHWNASSSSGAKFTLPASPCFRC